LVFSLSIKLGERASSLFGRRGGVLREMVFPAILVGVRPS